MPTWSIPLSTTQEISPYLSLFEICVPKPKTNVNILTHMTACPRRRCCYALYCESWALFGTAASRPVTNTHVAVPSRLGRLKRVISSNAWAAILKAKTILTRSSNGNPVRGSRLNAADHGFASGARTVGSKEHYVVVLEGHVGPAATHVASSLPLFGLPRLEESLTDNVTRETMSCLSETSIICREWCCFNYPDCSRSRFCARLTDRGHAAERGKVKIQFQHLGTLRLEKNFFKHVFFKVIRDHLRAKMLVLLDGYSLSSPSPHATHTLDGFVHARCNPQLAILLAELWLTTDPVLF